MDLLNSNGLDRIKMDLLNQSESKAEDWNWSK